MNDITIGRSVADKKKFGSKGTIFLGKHYVNMGRTTSLSNEIHLDVANSHVVFICGKRGGGKCLTGDTKITLSNGVVKQIKDLENSDHPILSLNQDLQMSIMEKDGFYKRQTDKILKIKLDSGKEIKCTPEHPLLTYYGWEEAQDLNIGTKIATPSYLPVQAEKDEPRKKIINEAYHITGSYLQIDENEIEPIAKNNKNNSAKKISTHIYQLPKHKLSLFLNRIFSTTAKLEKKDKEWELKLPLPKKALESIQNLLLRYGIVSRITPTSQPKLQIKNQYLKIFLDEIGLYEKNERKQKIALLELPNKDNTEEFDADYLELFDPDDWEALSKPFKENKSESQNNQNITQGILKTILNQSQIYWDEITKIELINKKTTVYDFSVPETHNFVANDIIVHNSYTMGVFAEGVADLPREVKQNIAIVMLDTMGVYWTMKYPNSQDKKILKDWNLEGKPLDVEIFTPFLYHDEYKKKGVPTDKPFAVKPSELSGTDWITTFELKSDDPTAALIEKIITELQESEKDYDLDDIVTEIEKDKDSQKHIITAAKNRFHNAKNWGLFDKNATKIKDIVKGGQVSVLDLSCYATRPGSWNIKNLVVGLVSQNLFIQRMSARKDEEYQEVHKSQNPYGDESKEKQEDPLVWLVIDEAHEFLPNKGHTLASEPLITILREGRQPGISLVLATQQPGKIHTDVMTQSDTVIAHRITAKLDTEALGALMQSYMREGLVEELDKLPREKGAAIIFDDTNEKMYPMRVRPRFTWHGGGSPMAIKEDKKRFL